MADIPDKYNLNTYLQPENTPVTNAIKLVDSTQFSSIYDAGAVGNYNINNFEFGKGSGGTIVLGGADNGDGLLLVNNSGGTNAVTINNEGITVNDGSIVIKNALGSVIVNNTGLTSYNFNSGGTSESAAATITGTAFGTLGGVSVEFGLSKKVKVLFLASNMSRNRVGTTTTTFQIQLYKSGDGTTYTTQTTSQTWYLYEPLGEEFENKFFSGQLLYEVDGSGTFNYWRAVLECKVDAGTAISYNRQLNYLVLGY